MQESQKQKIKCIINTTMSQYVSKEGSMIVLPGFEGQLGVLFKHIQMVAELTEGSITIYDESKIIETIELKTSAIAHVKEGCVEIFS